ncbi:Diacylglycerol kinase [Kordia antarctica]|uniref:Diacylglycerol kinase n=1 Tax=Kordia antarctica TaxID=1218801 RepID=A0A7L4ZHS3_9FLAO|nr:diacylglycerol kinase family protein [Kordia antarctica]QHI36145.1 Diacylglycerol kinase [Kordia antarctica]
MKQIHFIINPIAGSGKTHKLSKDYLATFFEKEKYVIHIEYSNYKKHAAVLAKKAMEESADIIVACGGDGTINEVASCIVGSTIKLGIIPTGSGNGLASNLKISKHISKAIQIIKNENVRQIDVGIIHDKYFFSNAGVGFDACVVKNYESSKRRKFKSYIKAALKSFKELRYDRKIEIELNNTKIITNPFMIFVSNSNEMGYNISLTPKASLHDGLLDMLIVSKISKFKVLLLGFLILIKKQQYLKEANHFQTKLIKLTRHNGDLFQFQIDGEAYIIEEKTIFITIKEKALHVIS